MDPKPPNHPTGQPNAGLATGQTNAGLATGQPNAGLATGQPNAGLATEQTGAGDPLVLIHGPATTRRIWDPVVPILARGRRVITIDVPGFGESAPAVPASGRPLTRRRFDR